jgi:Na+/melibiose symporter-like transporter
VHNILTAPKINWLMGLVDDCKRGSFTAIKEIISLISGTVVSLVMGMVIDGLEAKGNLNLAFIVTGCTVFALTMIHALTLICTKEKPEPTDARVPLNVGEQIKNSLTDRSILTLIPLFALWSMATSVSTPFYGTYQLGELGFNMTAVAILSAAYSLVRSLFSIPLGKFADKHSFVNMLNICFPLMILAFGMNIFGGKVCYIIYYLLYAIALAGINSGTINLIYDYTPHSNRTGALAIKNTISGLVGFFTTLAAKPLLDYIQANGNKFLGIENVYAQQVLSFISMLLTGVLVLYLNLVVRKLHKPTPDYISDEESISQTKTVE